MEFCARLLKMHFCTKLSLNHKIKPTSIKDNFVQYIKFSKWLPKKRSKIFYAPAFFHYC